MRPNPNTISVRLFQPRLRFPCVYRIFEKQGDISVYVKLRNFDSIAILVILTLIIFIVFDSFAVIVFASQKNSQIAFIKGRDVYVMDADGGNARQLTSVGPYNS